MKKFKCKECGYVHIGDEPPSSCPVCAFDAEVFFEMDSDSGVEEYEFFDMIDTDNNDIIKSMRNQFSAYSELASISLAMSIQAKNEGKHFESEKLDNMSKVFSKYACNFSMFLGEYLEFNTDSNLSELEKKVSKINSKNKDLLEVIESEGFDEYIDYFKNMIERTKLSL